MCLVSPSLDLVCSLRAQRPRDSSVDVAPASSNRLHRQPHAYGPRRGVLAEAVGDIILLCDSCSCTPSSVALLFALMGL